MAHELTIRENGFAEMAFVGQTPWHSLGNRLQPNSTIEEWRLASGLNFDILSSPVHYMTGEMQQWAEQRVLYRSDNKAALGVVSNRFNIVQPADILEFFRDLIAEDGFQLETAGTLKGGKRIWALARTGFDAEVVANDKVKTYLLLVTGCDGGLSTTAQFQSIRVVCNNTLQMSLNKFEEGNSRVKVRHTTVFNPTSVKGQMGLNAKELFNDFIGKMQHFSNISVNNRMAEEIVAKLFSHTARDDVRQTKGFQQVMQLFNGAGKGSRIEGVRETGWGLMNAVTEYVDYHIRATTQDNRLNSAWFGEGAKLKEKTVSLLETV